MLSNLHYQEHGLTGPDAPVLVLIHGLFGSADNLSVIRRHFEGSHRVLNFDLPDHGLSPWSAHFSFANYASQIVNTLRDANVANASFVSHSLGGKVAMYLAHLHPEIVEHIVCLDIAPVAYEPRHHNVLAGLTGVNLAGVKSRKDAQQQLAKHVVDLGTQAFLLKSLYQSSEGDWAWRFNLDLLVKEYSVLSQWDLDDQLVYADSILFIKGSKSDYITRDHQATINQQFPKASAKIVDAGHWLHAEKPNIVNTLITKHLLGS